MKKQKFQINLDLKDTLPPDFTISFNELKDWHLAKYKPSSQSDIVSVKFGPATKINLIYDDPHYFAGRFKLKYKIGEKESDASFDFMIAKHIKDRTKNICRWNSALFSKLTKSQVDYINKKVVDQIMPECFERLRLHKEFLKQKKINSSDYI